MKEKAEHGAETKTEKTVVETEIQHEVKGKANESGESASCA